MNVIRGLENLKSKKYSVVTIGTFDGMHLGHLELLKFLSERKKSYEGESVLITFDPHPRLVLNSGDSSFKVITSLEEKINLMKKSDVDTLLILPFTKDFSKTTGQQFIENILVSQLQIDEVVVGYDHAFGHKRSGNIEMLQQYAERNVFKLEVFEPHIVQDNKVKSSLIRKYLLAGDVNNANELLGETYTLSGKVVKGIGRGRQLNFPTANLAPSDPNKLVPGKGIYVAKALLNKQWYPAAVSIGNRPTFNEHEVTIEAFLIDFERDIYGEELTIHFIQRIRDELKFTSEKELIEQMHLDVLQTRDYFNKSEILMED